MEHITTAVLWAVLILIWLGIVSTAMYLTYAMYKGQRSKSLEISRKKEEGTPTILSPWTSSAMIKFTALILFIIFVFFTGPVVFYFIHPLVSKVSVRMNRGIDWDKKTVAAIKSPANPSPNEGDLPAPENSELPASGLQRKLALLELKQNIHWSNTLDMNQMMLQNLQYLNNTMETNHDRLERKIDEALGLNSSNQQSQQRIGSVGNSGDQQQGTSFTFTPVAPAIQYRYETNYVTNVLFEVTEHVTPYKIVSSAQAAPSQAPAQPAPQAPTVSSSTSKSTSTSSRTVTTATKSTKIDSGVTMKLKEHEILLNSLREKVDRIETTMPRVITVSTNYSGEHMIWYVVGKKSGIATYTLSANILHEVSPQNRAALEQELYGVLAHFNEQHGQRYAADGFDRQEFKDFERDFKKSWADYMKKRPWLLQHLSYQACGYANTPSVDKSSNKFGNTKGNGQVPVYTAPPIP